MTRVTTGLQPARPTDAARATARAAGFLRAAILACWLAALAAPAVAADDDISAVPGRPISEIIDAWRRRGVPFAYSTELVPADMVVIDAPTSSDPVDIVRELLAPYRLQIRRVEGLLVIGRAAADRRPVAPPSPRKRAETIAEVTVSASRYEILRELLDAPSFISQRTIQQLPLLGEDPMRAVQRLPGNASSGASAKSHLRGGEQQDTGLILNGQRLLDPFHVRDYQNLFSAIDSRAINGIEVYTGGFPVKYGDGIGGLVLIDTVTPDSKRHTEIGLSVYNTSFLSAGQAADGDLEWLLSARRGNLDLVLNKDLGEPSYNDVFAEIGINLSPTTRFSVNGLVATDNVVAVTEADPLEREASINDTRNAQFWINWSQDWSDRLNSYTTLSTSALNSNRTGAADDPEEIVASVDDRRDVNVWGLQQDWTFDVGERHRLTWGATFRRVEADFRYRGNVDYFGVFARIQGPPSSIRRAVDRRVDGDSLAWYVADRWQLGPRSTAEIGLRWDKQGYTDVADEDQFSPRLSLLHALTPHTDLRFSAGRYYQSQAVHELQVDDGITEYFPAQRADQFIASIQHRFNERFALRAEAYWKDLSRLRTRYENLLDPLAVMPELKPDRVAVAATTARARGLELSVAYENDKAVSWWASYTLAEVEDRVGGHDVARSWDQRHAGQVGALWQNGHWDLSLVANAHSGWPRTALEIDPQSDPDDPELRFLPRNSDNFAPFFSLDLRVAYRSDIRYGRMTLFFELSNATNRRNPCCIDFEIDDEGGGMPVLLQRDEYWFPLLPAVGVLLEF